MDDTFKRICGKAFQEHYHYYVVDFDDGLELIPRNWIIGEEAYCPKESSKFYSLVKDMAAPKPEWPTYNIQKIYAGSSK